MRSALLLAGLSAAAAVGLRGSPVNGVCSDPAAQEAGYYDAAANKHYFYYMASSRSSPATDPVVLWLTGGPGCSSLLAGASLLVRRARSPSSPRAAKTRRARGRSREARDGRLTLTPATALTAPPAFSENGPCLVPETGPNAGKAVYNPYAWNSNATVIWLDQPAGVGFSYGSETDKDEADVAVDAYAFLQAFFKAHPALATRPFFVAGESYGGHYAPAISYAVAQGNKNLAPGAVKIPLSGLLVGNGLTVPLAQYPKYAELAYNYSITKLGHPVITLKTYQTMVKELATCLPLIERCQTDTTACSTAQSVCNNAQIGPYEATGLNPYDIRIPCEVPGLCYDESHITAFFNDATIQKALGVDQPWQTCNYNVNGASRRFLSPLDADPPHDADHSPLPLLFSSASSSSPFRPIQ